MSMLRSLFEGSKKPTSLDEAQAEISNLQSAIKELERKLKDSEATIKEKEGVNVQLNDKLGANLEVHAKISEELKKLKSEKEKVKAVTQGLNAALEAERKRLEEEKKMVATSARSLSEQTRQFFADKSQFESEKIEQRELRAKHAQQVAQDINASNTERDAAKTERDDAKRDLTIATDMLTSHSAIYNPKFKEYHKAKNELIAILNQIKTKVIFPTGDDVELKKSHDTIRVGLINEVTIFLGDIELEMDNKHTPATIRHVTAALQALNTDSLTAGHATNLYNQASHHDHRVSNTLKLIGGFLIAAFGIALAAISMTVLGVFTKGMLPAAMAAYATKTLVGGAAVGTTAGIISLVCGSTLFGSTKSNNAFHGCRVVSERLQKITTHQPAPAAPVRR